MAPLSKRAFVQGFLETISSFGFDRRRFEKAAELAWVKQATVGEPLSWASMAPTMAQMMFPQFADAGEQLEAMEKRRFAQEDELARRKKKQMLLEAQQGRL